MIRAYEKEVSWKAGALALGVHLALLGALLISFNWKAAQPVLNIAEVELWDSLPNNAVQQPEPIVEPIVKEQPEPILKETPKPEPVLEDKPKEEPQVDIALEKKKKELAKKEVERKELEQKKIEEQLKKDKALEQKKQLEAIQGQIISEKPLKDKKTSTPDALKKLQQEALADDKSEGDKQAVSAKAAANAGVVGDYINKIQAKIRGNVNKTLCGEGNPELKFDIGLLPTGQLSGSPKLVKSSGSSACDDAVERAIMASEPLPLPADSSLFTQFRSMKLKFRPND
jgi:colicin import membrane protein